MNEVVLCCRHKHSSPPVMYKISLEHKNLYMCDIDVYIGIYIVLL